MTAPTTESFYKLSLRRQLFSRIIPIFLTFLFVVGVVIFFFGRENEARLWEERQDEAARFANQTVTSFVDDVEATLMAVGAISSTDFIKSPELLDIILQNESALLEIIRVDASGQPVAVAFRDTPVLNDLFTIQQANWFKEAIPGQFYSSDVSVGFTNEPYLILSTASAKDNSVVAARLSMAVLWDTVTSLKFGDSGLAYVIDEQGQLIAHPDTNLVISSTDISARPEIQSSLAHPDQRWQGNYQNLSDKLVSGRSSPLFGTEWIIITEIEVSEISYISRISLYMVSAMVIFIAAFMLLVGSRFLNRLVLNRIANIESGAQRISSGDLSYSLPIKQYDEIGRVAATFNEMTDRLRERDAALKAEIEERKQAELISREAEARFRNLFANSPDAILLIDPHDEEEDWPIVDCNDVACQMNGYTREELIGQSIDILNMEPAIPGEREAYLSNLRQAGQLMTVEAVHRHKDGHPFSIESATSLIEIEGREFVLGVDRDITDRKKAERIIQQANAQLTAQKSELEAINHELDQFAYIVSHDLKAPLRGINNLADWIEEDMGENLPEEVQEHMVLLRERISRMYGMIDGILSYSRAGRQVSSMETVNVNTLLVDVLDFVAPPATFTVTCAPDMPALRAEKVKLEQVFSNLISNAIKYHDKDNGRIDITVQESDGIYQFAVIDDGPGIPAEFHEKIFVMFQSASTRQDVDNTGVGLAIVKKIIEEYGGKIWVASTEGEGATFYFTWPKPKTLGATA